MPHTLSLDDFATLFGVSSVDMPDACRKLIAERDWSYDTLPEGERDAVILELLHRIDRKEFSIVKDGDKARWQKGWGENLDRFVNSKGSMEALTPQYIRKNVPMRLNQNFITAKNSAFEEEWYNVFRQWLFTTYLKGFKNIFEFGCGSGFNVATLARMYPDAAITGLDWVQPPVDIITQLHEIHGLNARGRLFDFFNPDYTLDIPSGSAVLTVGALEQTGMNNAVFLDFLMKKRPALVVHVEPIYEWYDPNNLIDYTAIRSHEVRNFWRGYPDRLTDLEANGQIEIIKKKRSHFGSLVLEGYSQLIWRPKG